MYVRDKECGSVKCISVLYRLFKQASLSQQSAPFEIILVQIILGPCKNEHIDSFPFGRWKVFFHHTAETCKNNGNDIGEFLSKWRTSDRVENFVYTLFGRASDEIRRFVTVAPQAGTPAYP